MALEKCPHMVACCPHYRRDCRDPESKFCHHIKRTRAAMIATLSALQDFDVDQLSEEMLKYKEEAHAFLGENALPRSRKTRLKQPITKW